MHEKQFFKIIIFLTLAIFVLPALVVVAFDPFFVLHKPFIHKDIGFDGTDRYQNAGLINSYLADPSEKIDTIIIGTSMSQNLPVSALKNKQGINALKLTMAGGKPKELGLLLNKALKTGRVKHVVWEIFTPYASDDPNLVHKESPLPEFLYNQSRMDNWRYIFNNDVVEEALKAAMGKRKKRKTLENLYTWEKKKQFEQYSSKKNTKKVKEKLANTASKIKKQYDGPVIQFPNIEQHVLPFLKSNPDIRFSLYFPPISYYGYTIKGNTEFWRQMKMREFLLQKTQTLENVSVYAFDSYNWGNDLSNYMDNNHYSPDISEKIATAISKGEDTITIRQYPAHANHILSSFLTP